MSNPHYDEARRLSAEASLYESGFSERTILATRAQAEATLAIVYELQQNRQPATTEPPHTGAAPVTSGEFGVGDWVRVVGPNGDPLIGQAGRVRRTGTDDALIDFSDMRRIWVRREHLEPAPKPTAPTPRH